MPAQVDAGSTPSVPGVDAHEPLVLSGGIEQKPAEREHYFGPVEGSPAAPDEHSKAARDHGEALTG